MKRKHKPAIAGEKYETFDAAPGTDLYKGAHVRAYTSKLRAKVSGPSGEILYFVCPTIKGAKVWRAFVAWRPEEGDHYDQFVDVDRLRLESTPPPPRKERPAPEPEAYPGKCPEGGDHVFSPDEEYGDGQTINCEKCGLLRDEDLTACDCGGDLKFDPDLVGNTCGGLTRIGWNVCVKCGKGWYSSKGTVHEGKWKLAGGGRSVETGVGRIRVDGAKDAEKLMARIAKLPELELEVARLRKQLEFLHFCASLSSPHGRRVDVYQPSPEASASPWKECQLVINGIDLRDGDRILKINQPEAKENGAYVIRLEKHP